MCRRSLAAAAKVEVFFNSDCAAQRGKAQRSFGVNYLSALQAFYSLTSQRCAAAAGAVLV